MRSRFFLAALVAPALLLAACGGGDDDVTPTPSGPPLSDQDYVRGLCTNINEWVAAALSKSTVDELRAAVDKLVADTSALSPPADARDFHNAFVKYLENAGDDPTLLLTESPPQPAQDIRARLASVERTIPDCQTPLFARESPSPTPGG